MNWELWKEDDEELKIPLFSLEKKGKNEEGLDELYVLNIVLKTADNTDKLKDVSDDEYHEDG